MINVRISGDTWTDVTVPLPRLSGKGCFHIKCPSTVRCATPRVLLDGTPLAIDVAKAGDGVIEVSAGPLVGGTLVVAVRAVPPITVSAQGLRVECDGEPPVLVSLSLSGAVRFVEGRSGWTVPTSVNYGEVLNAELTLRNDGTVDLERGLRAPEIESRLHALYPTATFSTLGRSTLLVSASNSDLQQMQALISAIDAPPATPTPAVAATPLATEAIRIFQAQPKTVAREVAGAVHGLRVQIAGQSLILAMP